MDRESEYARLADQAERLSTQSATSGIADSWRLIARGFRQLASLHAAALRSWQAKAWEHDRNDRPAH